MNNINTKIISNWITQNDYANINELSSLISKINDLENIINQIQNHLRKSLSNISFLDLNDLSNKIYTILYSNTNNNMKGVLNSSVLLQTYNLTENDIKRLIMFFQLNNKLNEFYMELKTLLDKIYDIESYNLSSLKSIKNIIK